MMKKQDVLLFNHVDEGEWFAYVNYYDDTVALVQVKGKEVTITAMPSIDHFLRFRPYDVVDAEDPPRDVLVLLSMFINRYDPFYPLGRE